MVSFSQGLIEKGVEKVVKIGEKKGVEKGVKIGEKKGVVKGVKIGEKKTWKKALINLVVNEGNSFSRAASMICIPEEEQPELKEELIREHLIPMDA